MSGRHVGVAEGGRGRIWLAGLGIAMAGVLGAVFVVPSGATAATPKPNYTAGTDTATFTVTGVLDHNCLVSTGGTAVWIKPGDAIKFKSSLAGISVGDAVAGQGLGGLLNTLLQPGQVAGLNVTAKIYTGKTAQTVTVAGGKTTSFPGKSQHGLSAGDHKITWQATGLALVPGLTKSSIPLSSSSLKSGAELSWTGVIHVTNSAPQCKLSIGTPQAKISVGPVHVSLPPVNVSVPGVTLPTSLPSVPDLNPSAPSPAKGGSSSAGKGTSSAAPTYRPPGVSVPQEVVPGGTGSGGGYGGSGGDGGFRLGLTGTGSSTQLALNSPASGSSASGSTSAAQAQGGSGSSKPVDLASSSSSPSGQLPVLLAILAVITLASVAGIYARIYLLGRKSGTAG